MSNKTQLSTNNDKLASLIQELANKAAGGGSGAVETCTVTVSEGYSSSNLTKVPGKVGYTAFENGKTIAKLDTPTTANHVISNVVKNSTLALVSFEMSYELDGCSLLDSDPGYGRYYIAIEGDAHIKTWECFVRDTMILLADGTTKPVQNITYDDLLLVWDFDNGCYAAAHPLWIKQEQKASYYYRCSFDNDTVLRLVGSGGRCHRVFSLDRNAFESATECVGERIMTRNGAARLLSCERIEEEVDFYNIITDKHINLYAEGVLTSCRLNNLYPIEDMWFVKDDRERLPLDAYNGVEDDFYHGLRLAEQKPEDVEMLNGYVANLYRHKA